MLGISAFEKVRKFLTFFPGTFMVSFFKFRILIFAFICIKCDVDL